MLINMSIMKNKQNTLLPDLWKDKVLFSPFEHKGKMNKN